MATVEAAGQPDQVEDGDSSYRPSSLELAMGHWQLARESFHELSKRRFRKINNVVRFIQHDATMDYGTTRSIFEYQDCLTRAIMEDPEDHKRIALLGVVSNFIAAAQYNSAIDGTIPRPPSSHYSYYESTGLRDRLVPALYSADLVAEATGLIVGEQESPFADLAEITISPTP